MTEYDPFLSCPVAFRLKPPQETIGSIVSNLGFKQFHCAETEKYPHVTFLLMAEERTLIKVKNVF